MSPFEVVYLVYHTLGGCRQARFVLTIPYIVRYPDGMNDVQLRLRELQQRGWTVPAIARAIGMSTSAVEKWLAGERTPRAQKLLTAALDDLLRRKRIPKRRTYQPKGPAGGNV